MWIMSCLTVYYAKALQPASLLGVTSDDPAAWLLPAGYGVIAVIGFGWGSLLTTRRPDICAGIGLGPDPVTERLSSPVQAEDVTR